MEGEHIPMSKKTYEVTTETGYEGRPLGATFEADLDPFIEETAIEQGWIKPVTKKEAKADG
jgi:hypothetical protein